VSGPTATSWADGPMIAFDCEATSADIETARIVAATCVRLDPPREPVLSRWLIAPDIDIPAEATAIHHITTEHAREHGRPAADVLPELADALRTGWAAKAVVVGHNVCYDLSLLDRELRRWTGGAFAVTGPVADSLALDRTVDRYRPGKRDLATTAAHYHVAHNGAHNDLEDALAAARICWRICRIYPEVGGMTPRELWRHQRAGYRAWAEHYQEYRRRKAVDRGEDPNTIVINAEWPLYPYPAA
jgi:DNA polymerase III subunit epsilon